MKTKLAIVLLLGFVTSTVYGAFCLRCRRPVCVCPVRHVAPVVAKVVTPAYVAPVTYAAPVTYTPVAQVYQPPTLYVTNVYSQAPNGVAGLIAQQGQSVFGYGYQAAAAAYSVNPAEVLRQAAELSRAASATASIGLQGYNQTAQTQLTLQAAITGPLARGQAAAQVLDAAGLSGRVTSNGASESIVLKITGDKIERYVVPTTPAPGAPTIAPEAPIPPTPATGSVLASKCAKCHGLALSEPKGSLYLDAGHKVDAATITKSLKLVAAGKMPPDSPLTDNEKGLLFDELLKLEQEE